MGVGCLAFFLQPSAPQAKRAATAASAIEGRRIIILCLRTWENQRAQLGWEQLPEIKERSLTRLVGTSSRESVLRSPERRTNIRVRELGDQVGSSPSRRILVAPPFAGTTQIWKEPPADRVKAIHWPSGDQSGSVALTMPPSETNYMGVMHTGDQPACKAAAMAFQNKVLEVAANPINY